MGNDHFKGITIQQMETLVALAEQGSFTRAAQSLFLSQPSLTKQMRNLEEIVGARLVNRKNTGVSLTPEGIVLYDYARKVFRLRDETREKISRFNEPVSGSIYLSASTIPATYILPRLLSEFRKSHPGIHVHLGMNDSDRTNQIILNNEAEIGFVGKEFPNRKLAVKALWKDRLVLAVPAGHPWAKRPALSIGDMGKEPFIIRERGSGTRQAIEQCLQKQPGKSLLQFNIVCEMGSSEAVKEAIIAGLGVSIISIHAIARELRQGILAVVSVRDCIPERHFHVIHKKQFPLTNFHRLFLEMAHRYTLE
jgi:DNA-binding transcriptional LysR family regulator